MSINLGEKLYKYNLKCGKLFVHEGEVIISKTYKRMGIYFNDTRTMERVPKELGVVLTGKISSLWLNERDDELAKRIFIEYEERKIAEIKELLDKRIKSLESLKAGVL